MPKRSDNVSTRRQRKPAGRNTCEPRCSLVKIKNMRRAIRYFNGEASITGYRTSVYRPWLLRGIRDGMPGKTTRQLGRPARARAVGTEETVGIRRRPKTNRARKGVGWRHSTYEPRDNITLGREGRLL